MDVAALEKLTKQSILNIVMVLGFLAHGYVTEEFEVTDDRLAVYSTQEHIDNPKGYAEGKNAKEYDPRLRGPCDPRELEIDPRSGMKNYIANENGHWDTSSGLVRRQLVRVIELGRQARQTGDTNVLYEAYRLLGSSLHTLEDFTAHSNWCELALIKLGHRQVFPHVGDNVKVQSPGGSCPPLVTGTFGGSDFIHSLLGEASDKLSSASISELQTKVTASKQNAGGSAGSLLSLMNKVPSGAFGDGSVNRDIEQLSRGPMVDPNQISPQEMYQNLWKILSIRDRVMKGIEQTMEKIPGLNSLLESISNAVSTFVFR
jgi:Heterokaryon incompatibility protein Het-C